MRLGPPEWPNRRHLVLLLPALVAFQAISTDLYLPALPALVAAFATEISTVQLTLSLFLVAFGLSQLVYGPASDRFGRRPALLVGTGLYLVASLACVFAGTIEALIALRILQGMGACAGPVLGRAVVRDLWGPQDAARVMAYLSAAMALAPTLGPILGGQLTQAFGWRASFATLALFGALVFLAVLLLLPETNQRRDPAALRPRTLARNYRGLLVDRLYLRCALIAACIYSGIFAFISGSPHVLIGQAGVSPAGFGLSFATGVLGYMAGSLATARLGRRLGQAALLRLGGWTVLAGSALGLALAATAPPGIAGVVAPMLVYMTGAGFILPTAMAAAIAPFPHMAGLASALLGCMQLAMASLIGLAISAALALDASARPMMLALALVSVTALLLVQELARRAQPS